jgi:deoxycytidine triphosphate deaminase
MTEYNLRYLWVVPPEDEDSRGTLLSDRIRLYVDAVHLIDPETFVEDELRPASYDLHVGSEYYVCRDNKDERVPLEPDAQLEIPANGLVYVATQERFNIPYYMVARYSLQVTQVYRGLLIENGLQIDPGYHGRIFVAVHNFTDQPRSLARGQPFLSIEFGRTTQLPAEVDKAASEPDLIALASSGNLKGIGRNPIRLFTQNVENLAKERTPPHFWKKRPGEVHKSSLLGMEERNKALHDKTRRRVRRFQYISIGAAFAFILTLVAIVFPWISGLFLDTDRSVRALDQRVGLVEKQREEELSPELRRMEERIEKLENDVRNLRPPRTAIPAATSVRDNRNPPQSKSNR